LRYTGARYEALDHEVGELESLGRWGKDIERFQEIRDAAQVTREQLAALMVRYFPQVVEFRQTPEILTDIEGSWANPEIRTAAAVGLIPPLPNHTFRPAEPITRADLAAAAARLARLLGLAGGSAPGIPLSDVAVTSVLYGDIQLVLEHGLMVLDDAGRFNPNSGVPGAMVVGAIEQLLSLAR
jgi:hypothetical protein